MTVKSERPINEIGIEATSGEFRWTADNFDRACDAGVFGPDARLELMHGRILERMGQGALHSILRRSSPSVCAPSCRRTCWSARKSPSVLPSTVSLSWTSWSSIGRFWTYSTITPPIKSRRKMFFCCRSLRDFRLSKTSARRPCCTPRPALRITGSCLRRKGRVVVHREPTPEGYGSVTRFTETDTLTPLAASDVTLAVRDLLGASG